MRHFTDPSYWHCYYKLPRLIQQTADKNFNLLKLDSKHPSLHLKKITKDLWSVRASKGYRALAFEMSDGNLTWWWIGAHGEYDKLIK
jgi:histidyl-tRNA synthetase